MPPVTVFSEPANDMPFSYRVFLRDLLRHFDEDRLEYRVVSPSWPVPGSRDRFLHLVVSAFYRHVVYPLAARRRFEPGGTQFFISTGLAHLLWLAPKDARPVMFCHDVFAFLPSGALGHALDFGGSLRARVLSVVQKPAIRRARLVIAPSECTRRDLIATTGIDAARVVVVRHRIDRSVFAPGDRAAARRALHLREDAEIVMAIVTHERRKNVSRLLEAIALVGERRPRLVALLVGTLAGRDERRAADADLRGRIVRLQDVDTETVALAYRAADCLACVSLYEGFGYPVLEAMSSGCPVVCSTRGALPEIAADCAEMVDPFDVAAIAAGIERVVTDEAHRADLAARGLQRAETFEVSRDYAQLVREVASS